MEATCQGPKQRRAGAGLGATRAETQPLSLCQASYLPPAARTARLRSFFFSRELKAPERLFIESAFECMPQHRYLPFKTEDGPFIKKCDRLS